MDGGTIGFSSSGTPLVPLILEVVAWLVIVLVSVPALRRAWAWAALPGGLLGLAVAATYLADELTLRSDLRKDGGLGAHVFDEDTDYPGILLDHDLYSELAWGQAIAVALVAAAALVAVVSRRRARPTAP